MQHRIHADTVNHGNCTAFHTVIHDRSIAKYYCGIFRSVISMQHVLFLYGYACIPSSDNAAA
jgi:hypothetical protein